MVNVFHPHNESGDQGVACSSLTLGGGGPPCLAVSSHFSGKPTAEEDAFYEKLNKLNESSGLSLLSVKLIDRNLSGECFDDSFNFRQSSMDLYQFYKMVTERGGYHQVTKDGKWEEVAFIFDQRNRVPLTPTQFQNLYATILYPFEQAYHYRSPVKHKNAPITCNVSQGSWDLESKKAFLNGSTGKRKFDEDELYRESPLKNIKYCNRGYQEPISETPVKVKEAEKTGCATWVEKLLSDIECERLKRIHGETPSGPIRDMLVEMWRHLSSDDKQPYIEASKKDKERYAREMADYEENKRNQRNQPQTTTQKLVSFSSSMLIDFTKAPPRKADRRAPYATLS
ncbi:hypothetical protein OSB04_000804 [Centaurea solstitialis]|uniref:Uncharacterized protein n=1 Tax=Centaurea solstitialis TaxID=347529 RepID=A0AA38TPT3_9ASTR|nr:hypothetical protein OSB04_000804 [Centaurea solstitialis]